MDSDEYGNAVHEEEEVFVHAQWEGTASELLNELTIFAESNKINVKVKSWPKTANALSRKITELDRVFLDEGLTVARTHSGKRTITISHITENIVQTVQPSNNVGENVDDNVDDKESPKIPSKELDDTDIVQDETSSKEIHDGNGRKDDVDDNSQGSKCTVLFLDDIPAWRGADGKEYGPFKQGEKADLPAAEAQFLKEEVKVSYV